MKIASQPQSRKSGLLSLTRKSPVFVELTVDLGAVESDSSPVFTSVTPDRPLKTDPTTLDTSTVETLMIDMEKVHPMWISATASSQMSNCQQGVTKTSMRALKRVLRLPLQ